MSGLLQYNVCIVGRLKSNQNACCFLHCDIFIVSILITTQPHLNVISGGELLHEPWRSVPGAACVVLTTSFPITQRIIWIEDVLIAIFTACITKVVMCHIRRNCSKLCIAACFGTRTHCLHSRQTEV